MLDYMLEFTIGTVCVSSWLPAERPVLKLLLLAFFWFVWLCAPIIVKFGREEEAANILLTAKVENFRRSFGELRPKKPEKRLNNLENAIKNFYFRPVSTNPLVKNYKTYNVNTTWRSTSVF